MSAYHYINTSETGWVSPEKSGGSSSLSSIIADWFGGGGAPLVTSGGGGSINIDCDGVLIDGICTGGVRSPNPTVLPPASTTSTAPQAASLTVNENTLQSFIQNNPMLSLAIAALVGYLILGKK